MLNPLLHYYVGILIICEPLNTIIISIVFFTANFPFLWNVLRAVAMRTRNAASYALLEDKIAELVEKRLESIRHNEDNVH